MGVITRQLILNSLRNPKLSDVIYYVIILGKVPYCVGLYKYGHQIRGGAISLSLFLYQSSCVYLPVGFCASLPVDWILSVCCPCAWVPISGCLPNVMMKKVHLICPTLLQFSSTSWPPMACLLCWGQKVAHRRTGSWLSPAVCSLQHSTVFSIKWLPGSWDSHPKPLPLPKPLESSSLHSPVSEQLNS